MKNVRIKKDELKPESVELLAKSVVQVANGFNKLFEIGLTKSCILILVRGIIGESKITKSKVRLVLDALPRLKSWYLK